MVVSRSSQPQTSRRNRRPQYAVLQQARQRRHIIAQDAVLLEFRDGPANRHMRRRRSLAGLEGRLEVEGLRRAQPLNGHDVAGVVKHTRQLERRNAAHANVVLLVGARRNRIDARRVALHLVLRHERRRDVLGNHKTRVEATGINQEWLESLGQIRVDEALRAPLGNACNLRQGDGEEIQLERKRLAMEVPLADNLTVGEDERVVGRGVDFDLQHGSRLLDYVAARAQNLGDATQRIGILHAVATLVAMHDSRILCQGPDVGGHDALPWVGTRGVDSGREGRHRAHEGLKAHASDHLRIQQEAASIDDGEAADGRHHLGAIDERESFLGLEDHGFQWHFCQGLRGGEDLATEFDAAEADEGKGHVRKGAEVAGCAYRAAAWYDRHQIGVEHLHESVDEKAAHAGAALEERVDADEHHGAHNLAGQGLADADGVAHEEVALQFPNLVAVNADMREFAEAGGDAVSDFAPRDECIHHLAARLNLRPGFGFNLDRGLATGDRDDLVKGQRGAIKSDALHNTPPRPSRKGCTVAGSGAGRKRLTGGRRSLGVAQTGQALGQVNPTEPEMPLLQFLGDGNGLPGVTVPKLAVDALKKAFRTMLLVRTLDSKLTNLQRQGRIGFYGACTGQEATPIGTAMALEADDWLFPALREGSAALHRGLKISHYVAQCLGNDHDIQKGRQMPCHYMDRSVNQVSWSSVIATQLPHAAGAAYGMKMRGTKQVAVGFMGDGATSENDFHSALNFAAVTKSPCIFVCQNNHFAISVQQDHQTATKTYAEKAIAYGMPGIRVDGNDILAVHAAVSEAAKRARNGEGPTLIEALTYRLVPHSTSDDPSRYRDEAQYQAWLKRDPVEIFRRHLKARKIWSEKWETTMQLELDAEVENAVKEAEVAGLPGPDSMFEDVYEEIPQLLLDQQAVLRDAVATQQYDWPPKAH